MPQNLPVLWQLWEQEAKIQEAASGERRVQDAISGKWKSEMGLKFVPLRKYSREAWLLLEVAKMDRFPEACVCVCVYSPVIPR